MPLTLLLSLAAAQTPPPGTIAPPPAPPPIVTSGRPQQSMVAWLPGEVRCGRQTVQATPMRRPWTMLAWGTNPTLRPMTYAFAIDGGGRTTGIRHLSDGGWRPFAEDIAPSLAATHFAAGTARSDCRLTYVPRQTTLAAAPIADLISYTITPLAGALPEEGWMRIKAGATCADDPRPEPLVTAFPDFRALPDTPGIKDWSMVAYDLDAKGRPIAIRTDVSTGNAALDAAALKAMRGSRFTEDGARRGCRYPYWKAPATLAAPLAPAEDGFRPAEATCPAHHDWSVMPTLRYPEAYRRRAIEGWAMIVYDVAPWGEVGNARVLAAEPSEDFGTQALTVIRSAKVATTTGLVGCVDRVLFKMPARGRRSREAVTAAADR